MVVNRIDIEYFIKSIKHRNDNLNDEEFANELASYIEKNPSCINMDGKDKKARYTYSTVGYGVFSLIGEYYRMGRIEIFDETDESGYAVSEGTYCMPFEEANKFEGFIESLESDFPLYISIGSMDWCANEVSKKLNIPVDKLNDLETKKEFYLTKQGNQ